MNKPSSTQLVKVQEEAIFNLYMYLAHLKAPDINKSFTEIINELYADMKKNISKHNSREFLKAEIIKNAVINNPLLQKTYITDYIRSDNGLTLACFKKPDNSISVVFKGTGSGEWIDNGEGLSGIPEENIYLTPDDTTGELRKSIVFDDYATDQQVEALNLFNTIAHREKWSYFDTITVSGHSKGGNKAQFIAINSPIVDYCYSFDGQGFSPEAINSLRKRYSGQFDMRSSCIYSIAAENDYVNVLGNRIMPPENIFYIKTYSGLHFMESLFSQNGMLNEFTNQGKLSRYIESISGEIMAMTPKKRQYATLGIMNVFQKYFGKGVPVNADSVTINKTIIGIMVALEPIIGIYKKNKS